MFTKVVVTGSLAYDHIMSMPGRFRDHILADKLHILNVSFIMNTFRREYGGTGGMRGATEAIPPSLRTFSTIPLQEAAPPYRRALR